MGSSRRCGCERRSAQTKVKPPVVDPRWPLAPQLAVCRDPVLLGIVTGRIIPPPDGRATEPRLLDRSRFGQRWPRCIPIPWLEAVAAPIMAPMSRHVSK